MSYNSPQAVVHAEKGSRAAAKAFQADHCGQSVWWLAIARHHFASAEMHEADERAPV